jgi:hypothetical protein
MLAAFALEIGGLDRTVPAFLAFPFVEFADRVDLSHHFAVDGDAFLRVKLLFL